jgi:accessory gene regulator protein AgrB
MKEQEYSRTGQLSSLKGMVAIAVCWLAAIVGVIFLALVMAIAYVLFFLLSYGLHAQQ